MAMDTERYGIDRNRQSHGSLLSSDEFLFGITGGMYTAVAPHDERAEAQPVDAVARVDEPYRRYPFSELVRLSLVLAERIGRVLRKAAREPSHALPPRSLTGAGG